MWVVVLLVVWVVVLIVVWVMVLVSGIGSALRSDADSGVGRGVGNGG